MTHPSVNSIVERLQFDAQQLRKMSAACKFAGNETSVRVIDPSGLLADLDEAATIISELQAENGRLTREIQSEKDESDTYCKWWREEQEVTRNIKARLNGAESSLSRIKEETATAMKLAEEALARCYDVNDWPADGQTIQDQALSAIRALGSTGGAEKTAESGNPAPTRERD